MTETMLNVKVLKWGYHLKQEKIPYLTLKTDILFENGDPIPYLLQLGFPFSNKIKCLMKM